MIFTLNARDTVLLPVIKDEFNLTNKQFSEMLSFTFNYFKENLLIKGIDYNNLKSALIPPHKNKYEIALVFDSSKVESCFYGGVIFDKILPLLSKDGNNSILCGDIISTNLNDNDLFEIIFRNMSVVNFTLASPKMFYVVYINNLTESKIEEIFNNLSSFLPFVGYVDTTFDSSFKNLLSHCLVNMGIKHKNKFILPHEDDIIFNSNLNLCGYNFEEFGFKYISIPSSYFDLFLSYKIESTIADLKDLNFSINSIVPSFNTVKNIRINVNENKLQYLNNKDLNNGKSTIMEVLGINHYTNKDLEILIKERIYNSYFYNLEYLEKYCVPKFNVSLELTDINYKKRKVVVSLKYSDEDNSFNLITMY